MALFIPLLSIEGVQHSMDLNAVAIEENLTLNWNRAKENAQKGVIYFVIVCAVVVLVSVFFEGVSPFSPKESKKRIEAELTQFLQKNSPTLEINFS